MQWGDGSGDVWDDDEGVDGGAGPAPQSTSDAIAAAALALLVDAQKSKKKGKKKLYGLTASSDEEEDSSSGSSAEENAIDMVARLEAVKEVNWSLRACDSCCDEKNDFCSSGRISVVSARNAKPGRPSR